MFLLNLYGIYYLLQVVSEAFDQQDLDRVDPVILSIFFLS